jgi:DNA-binding NtrC family response regulator
MEVIILTGHGTLGTAKEAMRLGAYDYLTKPFDLALVKSVIREALDKK